MERHVPRPLGDDELIRGIDLDGLHCKVRIRRFVARLTEIWSHGLNRRFTKLSMTEYAMKTGGVHKTAIERAKRIRPLLVDKPILTKLFASGEIAHEKILIVGHVATAGDEHTWADRVQELGIAALRELARKVLEEKKAKEAQEQSIQQGAASSSETGAGINGASDIEHTIENATGNAQSQFPLPKYLGIGSQVKLPFNVLVANRFLRDKALLSAKRDHEFTNSELLALLLQSFNGIDANAIRAHDVVRVDPITGAATSQTKYGVVKNDKWQNFAKWCGVIDYVESPTPIALEDSDNDPLLPLPKLPSKLWNLETMLADILARELHLGKKGKTTRHIPNAIQHFIHLSYAGLCVFPGCKCFARDLHHVKRYSNESHHAPLSIYPLCDVHHEHAHNGLIANEQHEPETWYLKIERTCETADEAVRARIDKKVRSHRHPKEKTG